MPPLEQLDPATAWSPASDAGWNLRQAAHLYRRAGFGFPPTQVKQPAGELLRDALKLGRSACVGSLLNAGKGQAEFDSLTDQLGEQIAKIRTTMFQDPQREKLEGWWLYRMYHSPHPLRERMTLFWHNHFATSIAKVQQSELMFRQNLMFRKHALSKFEPLFYDVSHDPAMLLYLDSNSNIKGRPNENYAREIMELFSLGVGNYTEQDIREAARAFTGWSASGGEFVFNKALHDETEKKFLGETGNLDGDDVVHIIMKQPAVGTFLAKKLWREFISEAEEPTDELIEPLANRLRETDYDLSAALKMILESRLFYSPRAYRARIKSPVEYVIGLARAFDARVSMQRLADSMDGLGQTLFAPPNVKGWDGGQAWLNTATLLARHNLAAKMIGGHDADYPVAFHAARVAEQAGSEDVAKQTEYVLELLLQNEVSPEARNELLKFAKEDNKDDAKHLTEVVHSILLMPEYQLA